MSSLLGSCTRNNRIASSPEGEGWTMDLPPRKKNGNVFQTAAGMSERVLVKIKGSDEFWFGRYFSGLDAWQVEGCNGDFEVISWLPLPKDGDISQRTARALLSACKSALKFIDSDEPTLLDRDRTAGIVEHAIAKAETK
jgi:hypothetical protein